MTREEIKNEVIAIVAEHLAPSVEVTELSELDKDLGGDSLDIVEIAMAVEEKFNLDIDDAKLEGIVTVGDVINLVAGMVECNTKTEA